MQLGNKTFGVGLGLALLVGSLTTAPRAGADDAIASFRAVAVNMSNVGRGGRAGTIDINIERWTSDEEREKLSSVLIEKNEDALLSALHKIKPRAGYIRTSNSIGYDLQYAREVRNDDGSRRIIIATDRQISWVEARENGRSMDYPFLLVEMRFDAKGKGTGKLAAMVKITYNKEKKTLELENWSSEPVRLTEIKDVTSKPKN
jgi:hypothetical protein